jgi:antitoxin (DNA-binding transcriptional repressor) of toxin-antitoxin stability system
MSTITVQEIQSDLVGFLRRVEAGEAFLLVHGDRAVAEVRPMVASSKQFRPYGLCAGQFKVPANFDESLPDEVLRDFEGQ